LHFFLTTDSYRKHIMVKVMITIEGSEFES
jgi:hypothetical protein